MYVVIIDKPDGCCRCSGRYCEKLQVDKKS